jgi:hypothetical protein
LEGRQGGKWNWDIPPCGVHHVTEIFGAVGRSLEIQVGFEIVCLVDLAQLEDGIVHGESIDQYYLVAMMVHNVAALNATGIQSPFDCYDAFNFEINPYFHMQFRNQAVCSAHCLAEHKLYWYMKLV